MSPGRVRICVVGMGIGRPNGRALSGDPRGEVVALCDLQEDRMREFAAELPGEQKLYTDYKKMCRDPEIDAVFVGTPNQWHVPVALEAVRRDKHVLVTKPLADAEAPARKLVAAAEKAGVVNMMSLSTRFGPPCRYLQEKAAAGYFGDIYYARSCSMRRNGIPAWNLGFIEAGGGAWRDMGVHFLDAAWAIMGRPRPVTVTGVSGAAFGPRGLGYSRPTPKKVWKRFAADDYAGGFIRFESGGGGQQASGQQTGGQQGGGQPAGLQIESFWASHQPAGGQIEIFGTDAGARLSPLTLFATEGGVEEDVDVKLPKRGNQGSWEAVASHFIECVLDGVACTAPLRQGLQVQQMLEALLRSAGQGREVRIKSYAE